MIRAFGQLRAKIREINRRFAVPSMPMSRAVRASLMVLRIYLLVLVALMVYKFVTLVA